MGRDNNLKVKTNRHYSTKMNNKKPQGSVSPWESIGIPKPKKAKKTKR